MKIRLDELLSHVSAALDAVEGELLGASTNHGKRIACLCVAMARTIGLDDNAAFFIAASALLHDNALSEYILSERPGKEQEINMVSHCLYGQRNVDLLPFGRHIADYVLYHHERPDGKGPFGVHGPDMPMGAALIAAADMVDAENHLQFFPAAKLPELRQGIARRKGSQFFPLAADALLDVLDENMLDALRDDHISQTYTRLMPRWEAEVCDESIMRIAALIAQIIDYKSEFTRKHSVVIARIAWLMGKHYGYSDDRCAQLYLAGALHDIGKIWIPTKILEKPGALTDEEFAVIKKHAQYTYDVLEGISGFEPIFTCAAYHHEKLDGSGYPFGLGADQLNHDERLLTCLDIYQAVSEDRPYHPPRNHKEAMLILYDMAKHGQIDADIVRDVDYVMAPYDGRETPDPLGRFD